MTRLLALGAAAVLAGCGSSERAKPFPIDENAGRIGKVKIGESRAEVVAALGRPGATSGSFTPLGEWYADIGGPPNIPAPERGEVLRYDDFAALLIYGRVYSMIVTGAARTNAGPGIGDSLSAAKKAFDHPYCGELGVESGHGMPFCSFPVDAGRIAFGEDPVKSITLTGHRR